MILVRPALLFPLLSAAAFAAADPPREKFLAAFAPFDAGPMAISPNGQCIAYARREKEQTAVYVSTVDATGILFRASMGKDDRKSLVGDTPKANPVLVNFLEWADNEHVAVATSYNHFVALNYREKAGRHLVDLNGKETLLGSESGVLAGLSMISGRRNGRIVAVRRGPAATALIEATASGREGLSHWVLQVNVATGKTETVFDEDARGRLIYDSLGQVRGRYLTGNLPAPVFLLQPDLDKDKWQQLDRLYPATSTPVNSVQTPGIYFGERAFPVAIEGDTLYFASNVGRERFGLYALDLKSGDRTSFVLEDPLVDLANPRADPDYDAVITDRVTHQVIGLRVREMTSSRRWLDPDFVAVEQAVKARSSGYVVTIVDWDDARDRFIVELHNRVNPGAYYLYTRSSQKFEQLLPLRTPSPALAKVHSNSWTLGREKGRALSGWLSLPEPVSGALRPVVVKLSLGAWAWPFHGFDGEVAALAQMGYPVLEVYPRGSAGFGAAHLQAGRHQFDAVAVEDIVAAIDALPPSARIDRRRVALVGERYGGYLALRALQLRPDRFTCAVTREPTIDLAATLRPSYPNSDYARFGLALRQWYFGEDQAEAHERAPATHPELISKPLFLAANPNSPRGNWGELKSFRKALTAAGNPPTFVVVTAGADLYGDEQARLWGQIEDFLNQNLGKP